MGVNRSLQPIDNSKSLLLFCIQQTAILYLKSAVTHISSSCISHCIHLIPSELDLATPVLGSFFSIPYKDPHNHIFLVLKPSPPSSRIIHVFSPFPWSLELWILYIQYIVQIWSMSPWRSPGQSSKQGPSVVFWGGGQEFEVGFIQLTLTGRWLHNPAGRGL